MNSATSDWKALGIVLARDWVKQLILVWNWIGSFKRKKQKKNRRIERQKLFNQDIVCFEQTWKPMSWVVAITYTRNIESLIQLCHDEEGATTSVRKRMMIMRKQDWDRLLLFVCFQLGEEILDCSITYPFYFDIFLGEERPLAPPKRHQTDLNIEGQFTYGKAKRQFVLVKHVWHGAEIFQLWERASGLIPLISFSINRCRFQSKMIDHPTKSSWGLRKGTCLQSRLPFVELAKSDSI